MNSFQSSSSTITKTGKNQAAGGASAGQALPVAADGNIPKFIRVSASQPAYFALGWGGIPTCANTDTMIQPGDALTMSTSGASHFACLQVSVAGVVQVSPLENQ